MKQWWNDSNTFSLDGLENSQVERLDVNAWENGTIDNERASALMEAMGHEILLSTKKEKKIAEDMYANMAQEIKDGRVSGEQFWQWFKDKWKQIQKQPHGGKNIARWLLSMFQKLLYETGLDNFYKTGAKAGKAKIAMTMLLLVTWSNIAQAKKQHEQELTKVLSSNEKPTRNTSSNLLHHSETIQTFEQNKETEKKMAEELYQTKIQLKNVATELNVLLETKEYSPEQVDKLKSVYPNFVALMKKGNKEQRKGAIQMLYGWMVANDQDCYNAFSKHYYKAPGYKFDSQKEREAFTKEWAVLELVPYLQKRYYQTVIIPREEDIRAKTSRVYKEEIDRRKESKNIWVQQETTQFEADKKAFETFAKDLQSLNQKQEIQQMRTTIETRNKELLEAKQNLLRKHERVLHGISSPEDLAKWWRDFSKDIRYYSWYQQQINELHHNNQDQYQEYEKAIQNVNDFDIENIDRQSGEVIIQYIKDLTTALEWIAKEEKILNDGPWFHIKKADEILRELITIENEFLLDEWIKNRVKEYQKTINIYKKNAEAYFYSNKKIQGEVKVGNYRTYESFLHRAKAKHNEDYIQSLGDYSELWQMYETSTQHGLASLDNKMFPRIQEYYHSEKVYHEWMTVYEREWKKNSPYYAIVHDGLVGITNMFSSVIDIGANTRYMIESWGANETKMTMLNDKYNILKNATTMKVYGKAAEPLLLVDKKTGDVSLNINKNNLSYAVGSVIADFQILGKFAQWIQLSTKMSAWWSLFTASMIRAVPEQFKLNRDLGLTESESLELALVKSVVISAIEQVGKAEIGSSLPQLAKMKLPKPTNAHAATMLAQTIVKPMAAHFKIGVEETAEEWLQEMSEYMMINPLYNTMKGREGKQKLKDTYTAEEMFATAVVTMISMNVRGAAINVMDLSTQADVIFQSTQNPDFGELIDHNISQLLAFEQGKIDASTAKIQQAKTSHENEADIAIHEQEIANGQKTIKALKKWQEVITQAKSNGWNLEQIKTKLEELQNQGFAALQEQIMKIEDVDWHQRYKHAQELLPRLNPQSQHYNNEMDKDVQEELEQAHKAHNDLEGYAKLKAKRDYLEKNLPELTDEEISTLMYFGVLGVAQVAKPHACLTPEAFQYALKKSWVTKKSPIPVHSFPQEITPENDKKYDAIQMKPEQNRTNAERERASSYETKTSREYQKYKKLTSDPTKLDRKSIADIEWLVAFENRTQMYTSTSVLYHWYKQELNNQMQKIQADPEERNEFLVDLTYIHPHSNQKITLSFELTLSRFDHIITGHTLAGQRIPKFSRSSRSGMFVNNYDFNHILSLINSLHNEDISSYIKHKTENSVDQSNNSIGFDLEINGIQYLLSIWVEGRGRRRGEYVIKTLFPPGGEPQAIRLGRTYITKMTDAIRKINVQKYPEEAREQIIRIKQSIDAKIISRHTGKDAEKLKKSLAKKANELNRIVHENLAKKITIFTNHFEEVKWQKSSQPQAQQNIQMQAALKSAVSYCSRHKFTVEAWANIELEAKINQQANYLRNAIRAVSEFYVTSIKEKQATAKTSEEVNQYASDAEAVLTWMSDFAQTEKSLLPKWVKSGYLWVFYNALVESFVKDFVSIQALIATVDPQNAEPALIGQYITKLDAINRVLSLVKKEKKLSSALARKAAMNIVDRKNNNPSPIEQEMIKIRDIVEVYLIESVEERIQNATNVTQAKRIASNLAALAENIKLIITNNQLRYPVASDKFHTLVLVTEELQLEAEVKVEDLSQ